MPSAMRSTSRAGLAIPRLLRLFLLSRRVPTALALLAGCGVAMQLAIRVHWISGTGVSSQAVPILIEGGAALIVTVAARSPFGEVERAVGGRTPWLRLGATLGLAAFAVLALVVGAGPHGILGGDLGILRSMAGLTGVAGLSAAVLAGPLASAGPLLYLGIAEFGINAQWSSPWIWPCCPPHDRGAAITAALALVAGLLAIALRGARETTDQ
jgi:hypothetical protein